MGTCEPGQGGNAAAINIVFMCLGEPPRLSSFPARLARLTEPPIMKRIAPLGNGGGSHVHVR